MTFQEYDERAALTAAYGGTGTMAGLQYATIALAGEVGEFSNKVKKVLRDDGGVVVAEARQALLAELGDCLWYLSALARELDSDLEDVAEQNIYKLASRYARGAIQGSGDNR